MRTLLDRQDELDRLGGLLDDAAAGRGGAAVVSGPPGIGKTTLLDALCERARAAGLDVLRARGGELERAYATGVVRQLLEPVVRSAVDGDAGVLAGPAALAGDVLTDRADADDVADFRLFHSLHWLTANLASRRPLLIAVDDAHWVDATSLGFLAYLVRRVDELPVVVALTFRPDEAAVASAPLDDVVHHRATVALELPPLTAASTAAIVGSTVGVPADDSFAEACHRATGGNPFLVTELARAVLDDGVRPTGDEVWRIGSLRPQAIVRSIDARLRRLSGSAQALAQAAAVFGTEAEFRHAAALAGLSPDDAAMAADELHRAWIVSAVDPLRFEHSMTRDALLVELSPARLARDHKRAADVLANEGAPADVVAGHLLLTTPMGDGGSARWLRDAADAAFRRGAPESALGYLERAMLEPPATSDRWQYLWGVGRARLLARKPGAVDALQQAAEGCAEASARPRIAADLAGALTAEGRRIEAYDLLDRVITELESSAPDVALGLEATLLNMAQLDHELAGRARERAAQRQGLPGATPQERSVLATVAYIRSNDGTPVDDVLDVARRAMGGREEMTELQADAPLYGWLGRALANLGDVERANAILEGVRAQARAEGSVNAFIAAGMGQAALQLTIGDIAGAADEAAACMALVRDSGLGAFAAPSAALVVGAACERDDHVAAVDLLRSMQLLGPVPMHGVFDLLLHFRGVLRGQMGEVDAGLDDLYELGRREDIAGYQYLNVQWRPAAVPLLVVSGRLDEARSLLERETAVADRRGAPRQIAGALRARALLDKDDAVDLLTEAVALLRPTPFRLDLAKALVDLGAALRRTNQRAASREPLHEALDIAFRGGATVVADRARTELSATGARPRRMVLTGPESLTPSERRVAELAAEGRSNPEIAQALFVTRKTVETHLGRVFQKLAISGRAELSDALATG